jgi:SAM-dependent methyltransferase
MTSAAYLPGNEWHLAPQRLDLLEAIFGPDTLKHLEAPGIQEDWRCLDVGAGGGSIAIWLSQRLGPTGRVVATDIDSGLLDSLDWHGSKSYAMTSSPRAFRALSSIWSTRGGCVFFLAERKRALEHMIDALRPGGWALIEEPDFITRTIISSGDTAAEALFRKVDDALNELGASHGYDRFYARRLFSELRAHGFTELASEGRVTVTRGSPAAMFYRLSTQQMREHVVADGRVSDQEVDAYCALLTDPSRVFMWPTMLATRGRKPECS